MVLQLEGRGCKTTRLLWEQTESKGARKCSGYAPNEDAGSRNPMVERVASALEQGREDSTQEPSLEPSGTNNQEKDPTTLAEPQSSVAQRLQGSGRKEVIRRSKSLSLFCVRRRQVGVGRDLFAIVVDHWDLGVVPQHRLCRVQGHLVDGVTLAAPRLVACQDDILWR